MPFSTKQQHRVSSSLSNHKVHQAAAWEVTQEPGGEAGPSYRTEEKPGLKTERGADAPQRAVLQGTPALFHRTITQRNPSSHRAQHQGLTPAVGTHRLHGCWGPAPGRKGISVSETFLRSWWRFAASSLHATPQQRRIGSRQGRAGSEQEKTSAPLLRFYYASLLNLLFDPRGRGQFGSRKAIVSFLL